MSTIVPSIHKTRGMASVSPGSHTVSQHRSSVSIRCSEWLGSTAVLSRGDGGAWYFSLGLARSQRTSQTAHLLALSLCFGFGIPALRRERERERESMHVSDAHLKCNCLLYSRSGRETNFRIMLPEAKALSENVHSSFFF